MKRTNGNPRPKFKNDVKSEKDAKKLKVDLTQKSGTVAEVVKSHSNELNAHFETDTDAEFKDFAKTVVNLANDTEACKRIVRTMMTKNNKNDVYMYLLNCMLKGGGNGVI